MGRFFVSFTGLEPVDRAFRFVMEALSRLRFSDIHETIDRSQVPDTALGSGTADVTTFLRGDRTWAVPAGGGGTVFTSVADGLAPASGGGTTNFLRADGTWVAPSGGGGLSYLETLSAISLGL